MMFLIRLDGDLLRALVSDINYTLYMWHQSVCPGIPPLLLLFKSRV